jgi:septum site-determining protein MinC
VKKVSTVNDNYVIFKGGRNGIIVLLDDKVDFELLIEQLRNKVKDAQKFFEGAKAPISFKGRILSEEQEKQCLDIIINESKLNITFVYGQEDDKINGEIKQDYDTTITPTKYYFGAIRSGQSINFEGSVVVMGDVNPGGEIIAEGNVIVIGTLKGLVHAGAKGKVDAFISALKLIPVQLRIADIITYFPEEALKIKNKVPEYAYIRDSKICVEPINKRSEDN